MPESNKVSQWFMKIADDQIFGPVPITDLQDWARQGRVSPGYEVSSDKKSWIPAEDLPELEMVWLVELSGGTTHIRAFGIPQTEYAIQYTESVTTPNWHTLVTLQAGPDGLIEYTDSPPSGSTARVYRTATVE